MFGNVSKGNQLLLELVRAARSRRKSKMLDKKETMNSNDGANMVDNFVV